jgi:hypothetical protein
MATKNSRNPPSFLNASRADVCRPSGGGIFHRNIDKYIRVGLKNYLSENISKEAATAPPDPAAQIIAFTCNLYFVQIRDGKMKKRRPDQVR